eukprot:scaffold97197_cov31-Tisochrysis_lutea.AAC.1
MATCPAVQAAADSVWGRLAEKAAQGDRQGGWRTLIVFRQHGVSNSRDRPRARGTDQLSMAHPSSWRPRRRSRNCGSRCAGSLSARFTTAGKVISRISNVRIGGVSMRWLSPTAKGGLHLTSSSRVSKVPAVFGRLGPVRSAEPSSRLSRHAPRGPRCPAAARPTQAAGLAKADASIAAALLHAVYERGGRRRRQRADWACVAQAAPTAPRSPGPALPSSALWHRRHRQRARPFAREILAAL